MIDVLLLFVVIIQGLLNLVCLVYIIYRQRQDSAMIDEIFDMSVNIEEATKADDNFLSAN